MTATGVDENVDKSVQPGHSSVPVVHSIELMSKIERKLVQLFKCCFYQDRCLYTTDDPNSFLTHLNTRHSDKASHCIYCRLQSEEEDLFEKHDHLIDHLLVNHGLRNFQCSLCIYRGLSISHVLLHQANTHGNNYQSTSNELSSGNCRVLVSKQIVNGPIPSETVFWSNCRVERVIQPDNSPRFQCLYCEFVSYISHVVFFHVCKVHPDYSLSLFDKFVDPLPEIEQVKESVTEVMAVEDEDAELDAIVNDLHAFGTIDDDDDDMCPVDDAPPEDFPDDPETVTPKASETPDPPRERLFPLKGVRIAKKKSEPQSKARKSTAKAPDVPIPEFDRDDDEDTDEHLTARQRIMRGYRPEQSAALFEPVALSALNKARATTNRDAVMAFTSRNMFKCLICDDGGRISRVGIDSHLSSRHNTTSSFKCSECTFVGSRGEITVHFKAIHSSSTATVKVVKFIVAMDETIEAGQPVKLDAPSTSLGKKKTSEKDPKNLSSKIKKSVFIGPKSWKDKQKEGDKADKETDKDAELSGNEVEETDPSSANRDDEVMEVDENVATSNEAEDRTTRFVRRRKRRASEMEEEASGPISIEELLTLKSTRERGSEHFFCLFCDAFNSKDFIETQNHMKRHLGLNMLTCTRCPTYQFETIEELKQHYEVAHPMDYIPLPNASANNTHINYITEFLNEQFIRTRRGDQMTHDQVNRLSHVVCPVCKRANKLSEETNYHFTKWKAFKSHFWKHANASFIQCLRCSALVPRTRKRNHLAEKHPEDLEENQKVEDIRDFSPFYHEPLPELALSSLKSVKRRCKVLFESLIKQEFEVEECYVALTRLKSTETNELAVRIKKEPVDISIE